jgi:chaperonin GroEL (HSP60 family)
MAGELDRLALSLNRLIEQERFAEAQSFLPEYVQELDRVLRTGATEQVMKEAMATFHNALHKARAARAQMASELSDVHRARAYTGETTGAPSGWQLLG